MIQIPRIGAPDEPVLERTECALWGGQQLELVLTVPPGHLRARAIRRRGSRGSTRATRAFAKLPARQRLAQPVSWGVSSRGMSLADKVVLVTGAARGMGREYVRGFRKSGARVIATDLAWEPTGASNDDERFLEEIGNSPDVLAEYMDITIDSHVKRVFAKSVERFGTIDVIVNTAGMRQPALYPPHGSVTPLETEVGDWQRMFDTHVLGTLRVIKTFVAPMLAHGRGSIISVGSGGYAAARPESREMPYQAAKAALTTMTLYLAHELKPNNIAANVILPGHTRSTGSDEQEKERR